MHYFTQIKKKCCKTIEVLSVVVSSIHMRHNLEATLTTLAILQFIKRQHFLLPKEIIISS